jgi:prenylcysteine oxidase/farnesylcysteine lyase
MATDGAVSVVGGNWQIFAGMLNASSAHVRLNTSVTAINRNDNGTFTVSYNEDYQSTREDLFDEIVIAGPLQDSNITISPSPNYLPRWIPYVTLHVTLFSSPHRLSGQFFNLASASVPDVILTTLPHGVDLGSQQDGVGLSGFWSISTLSKVEQKHYVYKVFSPQRLTGEFVARILGVDEPTGAENLTIGDLAKQDVSWFHEKVWHSYPYLYPRENFEEISLGPNIWYTGGIESFISAMETSSLMGRNVAGLMAQAWQKETRLKGTRMYQGKTEL